MPILPRYYLTICSSKRLDHLNLNDDMVARANADRGLWISLHTAKGLAYRSDGKSGEAATPD